MKEHIEQSIKNARLGVSNLTAEQLAITGFSTPTIRHLFNNLCNIDGVYAEVGLWCGGTFCSAFNKNLIAVGIEDFSQPFHRERVEQELMRNIVDNEQRAKRVNLLRMDFFNDSTMEAFPYTDVKIFFYDAEHSKQSQAKALPRFIDKLADEFIYIVDDYNWSDVHEGAHDGIAELSDRIEVLHSWDLSGERLQDDSIWHNGVAIFLIKKK